jgi:hypothetical protein
MELRYLIRLLGPDMSDAARLSDDIILGDDNEINPADVLQLARFVKRAHTTFSARRDCLASAAQNQV